MARLKLIFFFLLLTGNIFASPFQIKIHGTFPGAQGREIRLLEYGDQISYREIEIASTTIDEEGAFTFSFSRFDPLYVFFRIDHARMGLFIEPGIEYTIGFDPVDFDRLDDRVNPYLNPWHFEYRVTNPDPNLNTRIDDLEDVWYDFLLENFVTIQKSRNLPLLQTLVQKTDSIYGHVENQYFKDYFRYKFAYYQQVANLKRFHDLAGEYILNQLVLYSNTQYMNFFNTLFDTYIFAGSRRITITDLRHTVNNLNSYHALMDSLGKDTILRNEVIRELVMLKGLQDMHGNPDYHQANVESILEYVEQNSKFHHHRNIAGNILYVKRNLKAGTDAPSFVIFDNSGNAMRIPEDFRGKFLYLNFWTSWCESCQLDFVALNEVFSRFSDHMEVINISSDRHAMAYESYVTRNTLPGRIAWFNRDFRLLDAYMVRSLPAYVLIDRDGKIVQYPARRPSDDIVTWMEWLLLQERRSAGGR
jgi:peroxiredoxin